MDNYKKELTSGLFWTAINKYSGFIVQLAITSVLARLIAPEEFGVVAIAQVCIAFINIFTEMGIGPAVIQNKNLSGRDLDSLFTYSIIISMVMAATLFLLSPLIADYYGNDKLANICRLLSLAVLLTAMNVVPGALFSKYKEFKFIAIRNLAFQVISGMIAIIYAYNGGGCYALVIPILMTGLLNIIISLIKYPRHIDWKLNFSPMRKILSFSIFQFLFTLVNFFTRNFDKMIIGKYISMAQLGYYQKAYQMMLMPIDKVSEVFYPVLQPLLSEYQDQKQMIAEKYNNIAKYVSMISFPLATLLFFGADEIILLLFGSQWTQAVQPFKVLALSIPTQMLTSSSGALYQSANNTKGLFIMGCVSTAITVIGFAIASIVYGNITAVAWAWVICNITIFLLSYGYLYTMILNSSIICLLSKLWYPFLNTCLLSIVLYGINNIHFEYAILLLTIKTITSCIVSLLFLHITRQLDLFKLYNMLLQKIKK